MYGYSFIRNNTYYNTLFAFPDRETPMDVMYTRYNNVAS